MSHTMSGFIRYILHVFLILSVSVSAAGEYTVRNLSVADGLSSGYVLSITEDSRGYMWFATIQGLNRFDGNCFINFNTDNSGLSANELNSVMCNPANPDELWIATQRDGLCIMDLKTQEIKRVDQKLIASPNITQISPASDGGILLVHYHGGVQHLDPKTFESKKYNCNTIPGMPRQCWSVADDGLGHLYVGHEGAGISIINLNDNFYRNITDIPGKSAYCIYIDRKGYVWIGSDYGAARYNPRSGKSTRFVHSHEDNASIAPGRVWDIRESSDGQIWLATSEGGVCVIDPIFLTGDSVDNVKFTTIPYGIKDTGTSSPYMRCLYQDSHGYMWAGSLITGVDFINSKPVVFSRLSFTQNNIPGLSSRPVWSCAMSKSDGAIWFGDANGIQRFSNGTLTSYELTKSSTRSHTRIKSIMVDRNDRIWCGTSERGLLLFDPANKSFKQISDIPSDVRAIYDAGQYVLVGTNKGLFTVDGSLEANCVDTVNNQLHDRILTAILIDRDSQLWIGTFGKGLSVFSKNGRLIRTFDNDKGFPSNAVNCIKMDSSGKIWVGTRNGLAMFAPGKNPSNYKFYDSSHGIKGHVESVEEDYRGGIWASTSSGLARKENSEDQFVLYSGNASLPLNSFMENASVKDNDGFIYFASANGVFKLDPHNVNDNDNTPKAMVTDFIAYSATGSDNKRDEYRISIADNVLNLPYDMNTFEIFFNVPDFGKSQIMDYEYKLTGVEDKWMTTGDNSVVFRNIPPGKYKYIMRQRVKGGDWSEPFVALSIVIEPPLWLTWYAKLLYAIIISGVILWIVIYFRKQGMSRLKLENERENIRQKQNLNEEKLKFYTNITHELRTPLTLITGPLEDLVDDPGLPPVYASKIKLIHESSIRLLKLVNGLLDFRKTETHNRKLAVSKGNLSQLLMEMGIRYREFNRNPDVQIVLDVESNDHNIYYDEEVITTIVENLMSNAVKYTPKGSITLSLHTVEENGSRYSEIKVIDTGYGISAKGLPHIFERYYQTEGDHQASGTGIGLALVKNLVELHNATIEVESEENKGSVFTLRLKTDYIYPESAVAEKTKKSGETSGKASETPMERKRILVVDDNLDICQYLKESLSDEFDVETAANGWEGLKKAREITPDLIISDIMMPELDGLLMCRKLKEDIHTSHIPVILLTAKDSLTDKKQGYDSGADSYITKPFSAKLMRSRIHNIMDSRKKLADNLLHRSPDFLPENASDAAKIAEANAEVDAAERSALEKLSPLDRKFMNKVNDLIRDNLQSEDLGVPFLSDKLCVSSPTLYRKMIALLGMSANEYIRHMRLQKAKELIDTGEYTVSEIVVLAGFGSHSTFAKAFKKEYGCSASEYIAKNSNQ